MKGKNTYTQTEIDALLYLIALRNKTPSSGQKAIRQKMRDIGFYGKDDWGITDLQTADLHFLIKQGKIIVMDAILSSNPFVLVEKEIVKTTTPKSDLLAKVSEITDILDILKNNRFDPQIDNESKLPNNAGNYVICLREGSSLPKISIAPTFNNFENQSVIYTGIAGRSLKARDYKQHFTGNNSGRSTLRKSIGVLFGYKLIPRDKNTFNGKTKFNVNDEIKLTDWMRLNLIMYFVPTLDYNNFEIILINKYNPPLNLKTNSNTINIDFRRILSSLRCSFQR